MSELDDAIAALRARLASGVQAVRGADGAGVTYMPAADLLRALGQLRREAAAASAAPRHVVPVFRRGE